MHKKVLYRLISVLLALLILCPTGFAPIASAKGDPKVPVNVVFVIQMTQVMYGQTTTNLKNDIQRVADQLFSWNSQNQAGIIAYRGNIMIDYAPLTSSETAFNKGLHSVNADPNGAHQSMIKALDAAQEMLAPYKDKNVRNVVIVIGATVPPHGPRATNEVFTNPPYSDQMSTYGSAVVLAAREVQKTAEVYSMLYAYPKLKEGAGPGNSAFEVREFYKCLASKAANFYTADTRSGLDLHVDAFIEEINNKSNAPEPVAGTLEIRNANGSAPSAAFAPETLHYFKAFHVDPSKGETDVTGRVTWSTSEKTVADIGEGGVIYTGKVGKATLTAEYQGITAVHTIAVHDMQLSSQTGSNVVEAGKTLQVLAHELPDNTRITNTNALKWSSSNESIAKVSATGLVTGLRAGTVTIAAIYTMIKPEYPSFQRSITITVTDKEYIEALPHPLELEVGQAKKFTVTHYPTYTDVQSNSTYTYDKEIVSVLPLTGQIKGLKAGKTRVTITYGNLSTYIDVTVKESEKKPEEEVKQSLMVVPSPIQVKEGETERFTVTLLPDNKIITNYCQYSDYDKTIASVTKGAVTGKKAGKTTFTVTYGDITQRVDVHVGKPEEVKRYLVVQPDGKTIKVGKSVRLYARLMPDDLDVSSSVQWKSSNTKEATVSATGLVRGVKASTGVKISAICALTDGTQVSASVTVKVSEDKPVAPTSIKITPKTKELQVGESLSYTAVYTPSNAITSTTWSVDKTSLATITQAGKLTAKAVGTVKVTATTYNGLKATATVTITKADTQYRALLLGYNSFNDSKTMPQGARAVETSIDDMRIILSNKTQFVNPQIKMNRTLKQTKDDIKSAFKDAKANDVSLLYITGIGNRNAKGVCSIKTKDAQYWSYKALRSWLDGLPGKFIVILDMDYAGAFITKSAEGTSIEEEILSAFYDSGAEARAISDSKKYRVLTSCGEKQRTNITQYNSSYFVDRVGAGLSSTGNHTADANRDTFVSLQEMYAHINKSPQAGHTIGVYPKNSTEKLFWRP